jgi:hypothetical protein
MPPPTGVVSGPLMDTTYSRSTVQGFFGQPDVRAVDLGGLLAGVDLHPVDLALAAVGLGHRRVDHLDHHRRDVDPMPSPSM